MDIIKNKFLLFPFLFFFIVFGLDKIAWIPAVKNSVMYWKKIEPVLYESRNDLFRQLKERDYKKGDKASKRLGLILGSSRSSGFDSDIIEKYIPNSYTYNFSAPYTSPAYYYYWYDRIRKARIRPDFVILEIDASLFGPQAINYQLSYSFDMDFVWRHTDWNRPRLKDPWKHYGHGFSVADAEKYYAKQLFGFYKYPLKFSNIKENRKRQMIPIDGKWREIRLGQFRTIAMPLIRQVNAIKLGGIPNFFFVPVPPERLKEDARNVAERDLKNFRPDPTQVIFARNLFARLSHERVPVLVYIPLVSRELYHYIHKYKIHKKFMLPFLKMLTQIRANHPAAKIRVVDLNENDSFSCREFMDAYHLSGPCFPELTRSLLRGFPPE